MLPVLGIGVLVINVVGYFGGFLLVDFSARSNRAQLQQTDQQVRQERRYLQTLPTVLRLPNSSTLTPPPPPPPPRAPQFFTDPPRGTPRFNGYPHRGAAAASASAAAALSKSVVQHFEPCAVTGGRAPDNGRWYNFTVPRYKFYAYTALLDDRDSILSDPVLRIIGLGTKVDDDSSTMDVRLYCRYYYPDMQSVYVAMNRTLTKIGQGWVLNNEWLREYIFTCPLPLAKTPQAVTIVEAPGSGDVVSCMPVEVPRKAAKKEDFALCVQVAFDKLDPYRLTEWLELQWLLGVRRVGVYNMNLDRESVQVLAHYAKDGYVDLRRSDYIEHGPEQHLLHGSPVINDCLYRHMHLFHYVVVIDFDEVVVPRSGHKSLKNLVDVLRFNYSSLEYPPVNYIFYNNYYFLDLPPDTSISPYLTMMRYRRKAPVSPFGYSVKSIINTQACLGMHNHFCWTLTPAYLKNSYPHVVDHSIAVNHHYKKCHLKETECAELIRNSTEDDVLLQFKNDLQKKVNDRIFAIKGHNI